MARPAIASIETVRLSDGSEVFNVLLVRDRDLESPAKDHAP